MNKRVLLIGDAKSFMVNSIVKGLTQAGLQVVTALPVPDEIEKVEDCPEVIILYLEDDLAGMTEILTYLDDKIEEDSKEALFMIGGLVEKDMVNEYIPERNISGYFTRPLNVKQLAESLDSFFDMTSDVKSEEKKSILVVDDDGTMLRTLKNWLSRKYNVYMANSGMSAITLLAKNKVDLILLDYEMPVVSGPQVLEMIKSEPSTANIPVMFLTGRSDKESVMTAVTLKPEKYLLKSMSSFELIQNIDKFFAEH